MVVLLLLLIKVVSSQRSGGAPLIGPPTLTVQPPMIRPVAQPLGEIFAQKRVQWIPTVSSNPTVQEVPVLSHPMPIIVNDIHIRTIKREHSCPTGEKLEGRQCHSVKTCPPEYLCSPSTIREGNSCISVTRPTVECPSGHSLDADGSCRTCEIKPAGYRCDEGFRLVGAGVNQHCEKVKPGELVCPSGFILNQADNHSTCLKEIRPSLACPPEYKLSNTDCIRDISFPAALSCAQGAFMEDNTCVLYNQQPPRCPIGFTMEEDSCISTVPKVLLPCGEGHIANGTFCDEFIERPAQRVCPYEDMAIDGDRCIRRTPPQTICPSGFTLNALNKCERHTAPLFECNDMKELFVRGECLKKEFIPARRTCPPGFKLDRMSCIKFDRVPYSLECPIGSILHRTVCLVETETKDPSYICPTGMSLNLRNGEQALCSVGTPDDQVVNSVYEPKWHKIDEQSLSEYEEKNRPPYVPPTKMCLEGMYEVGSSCMKLEIVLPKRVCRLGYTADGGTCIREIVVPSKTECEPGTHRENSDECLTLIRKPATIRCPPGTFPDTTSSEAFTCIELKEPEMRVKKAIEVPAQWVCCDDGQLSSGAICKRTIRHISSAVCPPGSVDEGHSSGNCIIRRPIEQPHPERKIAPHLATWMCPAHSYRSNNQCLASESIPAYRQCPEPSILMGDKCFVESEPTKTQEQCLKIQAEMYCPDDAVLKGSSCIIHKKADAKLTCPDGFKLDTDRCVREHPLRPFCPHGTELRSGMCARDIYRPAYERLIEGCSHEMGQDGLYKSRCS